MLSAHPVKPWSSTESQTCRIRWEEGSKRGQAQNTSQTWLWIKHCWAHCRARSHLQHEQRPQNAQSELFPWVSGALVAAAHGRTPQPGPQIVSLRQECVRQKGRISALRLTTEAAAQ